MSAPPQSEIQKTVVQAVEVYCPHPLNLNLNDLNIIVGLVCLNQKINLIAVFRLSKVHDHLAVNGWPKCVLSSSVGRRRRRYE